MRSPLPLAALACAALAVRPTSSIAAEGGIAGYELRLDAKTDGTGHVSLSLTVDPIETSVLVVPFPFAGIDNLRLVGAPQGTSLAAAPVNGQGRLTLDLPPGVAAPLVLHVEGDINDAVSEPAPAGRTVRVALMNSQPATIRNLRIEVTFPDGLRGHAIREALPKASKTESGPRALLSAVEGRSGARLQAESLQQGETAALRVELAPAAHSPGWLIVGLLLCGFYLASFRDLVAPSKG
jgi:hypothetical protein